MSKRKEVGVRRLKNEASKIVNEVRENEQEYVVTKRGDPVAVIRPLEKGELEQQSRARVDSVMAKLRRTARQVAARAGDESAVAAVSRQRR